MRDRVRQRAMAEVKSRRATPEELREAGKRVKELQQEIQTTMELQPETKQGEERSKRYSRSVRLRAMRDDFTSVRPLQADHPNSYILAIVMVIAAFMLCGFLAGGIYTGLQLLSYKPSPIDTANAFWDNVKAQNYSLIRSDYLSPTLRVIYDDPAQFASMAEASDTYYGPVTNVVLVKQSGDFTQQAVLTYQVTRGTNKVYNATLILVVHAGSWGVDDLGSSLDPSKDGSLPSPPTPSPSPTDTPVGSPSPGAYRFGPETIGIV